MSGGRRDDAGLLVAVASENRLTQARMRGLAAFLDPGDVVVVNTSATLPAAIPVDADLMVHLSTELSGDVYGQGSAAAAVAAADLAEATWVVELRRRTGHGTMPWAADVPDGPIELPGEGSIELVGAYEPDGRVGTHEVVARLWVAQLRLPGGVLRYLANNGQPIRYGIDAGPWSLPAYQTVFATEPGSAEMPSAARGFTAELVTELVSKGVVVAPIVLHTGVASQEVGEPPYPEYRRVPAPTASAINAARAAGRRVVAVGTTATRAIESAAASDGTVRPSEGWTDLVVTPQRGVRVIDGLLTGWHDPEASHLLLVEAIAGGPRILDRSYRAALAAGFAGHEFGDFHLILP
jgi:S-adenosylmethionine:tRNA ribosyltransferase-isomerase